MEQITGMINDISAVKGVSKRTGKPYSIWWVDVNGTNVKAGFNRPGFNVGDTVTLDVQTNKYGEQEIVTAGKSMSPAAKPAPMAASGSGGGRGGFERTFPVKKDSPEMAIIRQNALTNAVRFLEDIAPQEYMCDEIDEVKSFEEYVDKCGEAIITLACKFAEFSSGQREVKAVERMRGE